MSELMEPQQLLERIGLISEAALAAMIGVEIKSLKNRLRTELPDLVKIGHLRLNKEESVREIFGVTGPTPPLRPTVTRKQHKSLSGQQLRCLDPAMWVLVLLALIVASPATAETDMQIYLR
jgi:hypothetical protein